MFQWDRRLANVPKHAPVQCAYVHWPKDILPSHTKSKTKTGQIKPNSTEPSRAEPSQTDPNRNWVTGQQRFKRNFEQLQRHEEHKTALSVLICLVPYHNPNFVWCIALSKRKCFSRSDSVSYLCFFLFYLRCCCCCCFSCRCEPELKSMPKKRDREKKAHECQLVKHEDWLYENVIRPISTNLLHLVCMFRIVMSATLYAAKSIVNAFPSICAALEYMPCVCIGFTNRKCPL